MSREIKVPVTFTFDRVDIQNMLESAIEQHSTYWCEAIKIDDLEKASCIIKDIEDNNKEHELTSVKVIGGLYKLSQSKQYFHHFRDIVQEEDDGVTADVLLQFCLFGEVLYS